MGPNNLDTMLCQANTTQESSKSATKAPELKDRQAQAIPFHLEVPFTSPAFFGDDWEPPPSSVGGILSLRQRRLGEHRCTSLATDRHQVCSLSSPPFLPLQSRAPQTLSFEFLQKKKKSSATHILGSLLCASMLLLLMLLLR